MFFITVAELSRINFANEGFTSVHVIKQISFIQYPCTVSAVQRSSLMCHTSRFLRWALLQILLLESKYVQLGNFILRLAFWNIGKTPGQIIEDVCIANNRGNSSFMMRQLQC
jgi:hypothetical protein